MRVLKPEVERC